MSPNCFPFILHQLVYSGFLHIIPLSIYLAINLQFTSIICSHIKSFTQIVIYSIDSYLARTKWNINCNQTKKKKKTLYIKSNTNVICFHISWFTFHMNDDTKTHLSFVLHRWWCEAKGKQLRMLIFCTFRHFLIAIFLRFTFLLVTRERNICNVILNWEGTNEIGDRFRIFMHIYLRRALLRLLDSVWMTAHFKHLFLTRIRNIGSYFESVRSSDHM